MKTSNLSKVINEKILIIIAFELISILIKSIEIVGIPAQKFVKVKAIN